MRFDRSRASTPAHARPQRRRQRRWGGLVVVLIYAVLIGASEWRLQQRIGSATTVEYVPPPAAGADPLLE